MKPREIEAGKTYHNRGKGRTRRTVLAISDKLRAPWFSMSEKPDEPVVLYRQGAETARLYLRSFAAWAGGIEPVTDEQVAARTLVNTGEYDPACETNWALRRLAEIGEKIVKLDDSVKPTEDKKACLRQEWEDISEFVGQQFTPEEIAAWYASYIENKAK
jgi:hypothetical protein